MSVFWSSWCSNNWLFWFEDPSDHPTNPQCFTVQSVNQFIIFSIIKSMWANHLHNVVDVSFTYTSIFLFGASTTVSSGWVWMVSTDQPSLCVDHCINKSPPSQPPSPSFTLSSSPPPRPPVRHPMHQVVHRQVHCPVHHRVHHPVNVS